MSNLANITISEDDYKSLLINRAFLDIKIISVKILPDDSDLKDNERYQLAKKAYRKALEVKETIAFNLITNL